MRLLPVRGSRFHGKLGGLDTCLVGPRRSLARNRRLGGRSSNEVQNRILRCLRVRTRSAPCERQVLPDRRRRNRDGEGLGWCIRDHPRRRSRLLEEGDRPLSGMEGSGGDRGARLTMVFSTGTGAGARASRRVTRTAVSTFLRASPSRSGVRQSWRRPRVRSCRARCRYRQDGLGPGDAALALPDAAPARRGARA